MIPYQYLSLPQSISYHINLIFRQNSCLPDTKTAWGGEFLSLKSFTDSLFPSGKILAGIITVCSIIFFLSASFQPLAAQDRTVNADNSIAAFDPEWLGVYYGLPSDSTIHTQPACPDCPDSSRTDTKCPLQEEPDNSLSKTSYVLSMRANLLRWATLTPDLGVEWRISPSVGILVNSSWTSWTSWPPKDLRASQPRKGDARRYALWEVMPEVRWYLGEKKAWYVGAMFKAGQFNYRFSGTGRQGDLLGGGITGGYHLRLTDALDMDFGLGLGYLNADTERYDVTDGVRVRSGNGTRHWIGPVNAGVTLVWKLF